MSPISFSLKTASEVTGLSQSHLKRAIGEGLLKAKRSTDEPDAKWSKYVIPARELEAYIDGLADA